MDIYGIVLAAGKGTRMKSQTPKVLHRVCGQSMIEHVVEQLEEAGAKKIVAVVGHGAEQVRAHLGARTLYAEQSEQLGTAHAAMQAQRELEGKEGVTLVLAGDTPLLKAQTLKSLIEAHMQSGAPATVLTAIVEDPKGYGRIVRSGERIAGVVEEKDASEEQRKIAEINTGVWCFNNRDLFLSLPRIGNQNAQKEYYLTDIVALLNEEGRSPGAFLMENPDEAMGVNDRFQLSQAEKKMRLEINKRHMLAGVTIPDPEGTHIGAKAKIGQDTEILPGCVIEGETEIGSGCAIGPYAVISDAKIEDGASVGPFARLRLGAVLKKGAKIGNFVEVKNSEIGEGTKALHLTYIGDASVGKGVNVGCGTVFVNYDGKEKHRSIVEDEAFIGCNANLVAPVSIGKGAFVAAGSTITQNVPSDALAIARSRQENKPEYMKRKK